MKKRVTLRKQKPGFSLFFYFALMNLFVCAGQNNAMAQYDTTRSYYPSGALQAVIPLYNRVPEGMAKFYYENGKLKAESEYVSGKVEGTVKKYRPDGTLIEIYTIESGKREGPLSRFDEKGNFIDEQYYSGGLLQPPAPPDTTDQDQTTKQVADNQLPVAPPEENKPTHVSMTTAGQQPFVVSTKDTMTLDFVKSDKSLLAKFDQIPAPAQGMEYFNKKLNYPAYAQKKLIQGTVIIKALVDEYGDIRSVKVIQGIGGGCDESASIAVDYTKFKPAIFKGTALPVYILWPVLFKLSIQP